MAAEFRHGRPTIGVLTGWQFYRTATNLSYLAPIFNGICRAAQNAGCNLLLGCGMGPSARPTDPLRPVWPTVSPDHDFVPIGPWNTDGLIVAVPLHSQARSAYIQELRAAGHPVLFIGSGEPGPTIVANNTLGIIEALHHLVEHGHKRIAFIAGTEDDLRGDTGERLRAYQLGCQQHNLDQDPRLVAYGRHVFDGGYTAMRQIMESGTEFTALLASNDESALGAMQALTEAGRRVPHDVAVIGFDNRLEGVVHEPGLTSLHVPLFSIGYRALGLLLNAVEGKADLPDLITVDTHLVIRESCGCRPGNYGFSWAGFRANALDRNDDAYVGLAKTVGAAVFNQAHSLTEGESLSLARRLVDTFTSAVQSGDGASFRQAIADVLLRTVAVDDDAHVWQVAVSLLEQVPQDLSWTTALPGASHVDQAQALLEEARLTISNEMRRQHRRYVLNERWTASRLSNLTARLLTALHEPEIFDILAECLSGMNIRTAMLGLFEAQDADPIGWTTLRSVLDPGATAVRIPSQSFPPPRLFSPEVPFSLTLIPVINPSGQTGYMVFDSDQLDLYGAIVQQVGGALNTARLYYEATEARRLAEEANRMKSRFLSTISHELRTPLNLIVGLSSMILRDADESEFLLPEAVRNDVYRIHAYSQHLGGLIGDVIDLATSDAGQLRLNIERVDLAEALRLVAESGSQLAADKGLAWKATLPESGPWVWGDQTRLRQVTLNLISNAIKFTQRGEVALWLEDAGDSVTINVRDTGLGISADEQERIFDEFRQSERSVARGYGGLGLGLAISRRLVQLHGGNITVTSTGEEGAGSTFSVTLPVVQAGEPPRPEPFGLTSVKQSVVVLSTNPGTSEHLCAHLRQHGIAAEIMLIRPAIDWCYQLNKWQPEAIILDISTDSAIGWNALKTIKASQPLARIPVLFFSSSQTDGALLELDYLTKPVEISELTTALDQHWLMTGSARTARTILVVDDEPNTVEMYVRIVQSHSPSNRILKAYNGREALAILHRETVDLVLLDLEMPEMDGFEVLEAMHGMETTRQIPVIVVTGKILTETEMARLNQGVAAVLGKGIFSIDETITHISTALEHRRKLSDESKRLVRLAMAYIHEHYAEPIARRDIAQHIGLNEDHLTFCFRQEMGTTPIAYLQRYRINQARHLLKDGTQSVADIALNVGFTDRTYFSRVFHRETGMSPEAYRRA